MSDGKKTVTPLVPDDLPESARPYWPDISKWPTAAGARTFAKSTRKKPEDRLAVLSGLRRLAATDLSIPWAWVAVYVPLVFAIVSLPNELAWLTTTAGVVLGVVAAISVARLIAMSAEVEERRKSALVWLRAFEDALAAE
jgi:hypothetical protein